MHLEVGWVRYEASAVWSYELGLSGMLRLWVIEYLVYSLESTLPLAG